MQKLISNFKAGFLLGILFSSGFCSAVIAASANSISVSLELLASPAPSNSSLSRLVRDEAGQVYLSWVNQDNELAQLVYSKLMDTGWSNPIVIGEGADWFINWADFPMLSVSNGNMAAHWLRISDDGAYDYDIEARFYDEKNRMWSEKRVIHTDGVSAEHGFVSMLPISEQGETNTLITWLDGRNTKAGEEYGEMTLRAGIFDSLGETLSEWEIDHRVCDCCQTSTAMTAKGPLVVYRDRSSDEIRDISMVRYSSGEWTKPRTIHDDKWQINGCPVNGPAVSAKDDQVAVAWFTAKEDTPKVQLALSSDSGDTFSEPIVIASPETNGRVDTAILKAGAIAVSWIDITEAHAKIMLSLFSPQGGLLHTSVIAKTSASRRSGFPIIESLGDSVFVTWTDVGEIPQVKVARLEFELN